MKAGRFFRAAVAAAAVAIAGCTNPAGDSFVGIELDVQGTHVFDALLPDYVQSQITPLAVTVSNAGRNPTGDLRVALSDPDLFGLSRDSIPSMGADGYNTFKVYPSHGLGVGRHVATVTVSGGGVEPRSFEASFTVRGTRRISHTQAYQMMGDLGDAAVILDVRTKKEFTGECRTSDGRIAGARWLYYDDIMQRAASELPIGIYRNRVILIYCRAGRRSLLAADKLVGLGYLNVYDFGGLSQPTRHPTPPVPWEWSRWEYTELVND